jgi:hypothetical protein
MSDTTCLGETDGKYEILSECTVSIGIGPLHVNVSIYC